MASQSPDPNIGKTDFPPETGAPIEKAKRSRFWTGCLIGCAGLIILVIILFIALVFYIKSHKDELIDKGAGMLKSHVADIVDEKVPQEKKDEFNNLVDGVVNEFTTAEKGEDNAQLMRQIQPFWEKFTRYQKDMHISEEELDDLNADLRKVLPKPPDPELE